VHSDGVRARVQPLRADKDKDREERVVPGEPDLEDRDKVALTRSDN